MARTFDASDAADQIAKLREQVETLMNERVTPALANAAGTAENVIHGASDAVKQRAEQLSEQVSEQPLMAVLIAAGLGFVLGRIFR